MEMIVKGGFLSPRTADQSEAEWLSGSASINSTRAPVSANAAARLSAVVVLHAPPFWLTTEVTLGKIDAREVKAVAGLVARAGAPVLDAEPAVVPAPRRFSISGAYLWTH